jgi:Flp pilus assembly pilin Flp
MKTTTHFFHKLQENNDGAVATEYALLIGFIALVIFSTVMSFGATLLNLFDTAAKLPF